MTDVLVIGGGVMGCATAAFLRSLDAATTVTVVEQDPTYGEAASPRASGGIRQLFSRPENILMSAYTIHAVNTWTEFLCHTPDAPDLGWTPNGYLFLADRERAAQLAANYQTQRDTGVPVHWLEPSELADKYPILNTTDLGGGVLCPQDGWLDPHAFLHGLRAKATALGARFVHDRVTALEANQHLVRGAVLASGRRITADTYVNVAGCWAPELAAPLGMHLPVRTHHRFDHHAHVTADIAADVSGLPFIKDPDHLAVRPEGNGVQAGVVTWNHPLPANTNGTAYFDTVVWPALAHRLPALDRLRLNATWSGDYDTNDLDRNMIIGNWPGHLDNFYVACGFSGHGLMHAPAVGRALSELILYHEYRSIDLHRLDYHRVLSNTPYPEEGVI